MSPTSAPASTVSVSSPEPGRSGPTRRPRLVALLCLACVAVLLPWVAYLSMSLPQTYVLTDWNGAWVGFDVLLMALLATTGVLTRRQHPLHPHAAFASAAFLVADAWFDVTTSGARGQTYVPEATADGPIRLTWRGPAPGTPLLVERGHVLAVDQPLRLGRAVARSTAPALSGLARVCLVLLRAHL